MSYIYTNNMIKLRGFTFSNLEVGSSDKLSKTFYSTSGNSFTGYLFYGTYYSGSRADLYMGNVLGYSPVVYITEDATELSRNDYVLPDDVIQISYENAFTAVLDTDGVSTSIYCYYTNNGDTTITINKIIITGGINDTSGAYSFSTTQAILFEELLDEPITLAPGERFARNFEFRLEVN